MINGKTILTGVFGWPVKHSLSPIFQNAAFQYSHLNWIYVPFEVHPENLQKAIEAIKFFSIKGINITIPHKKNVVKYLDIIDDEVKILGVPNTIINKNGVLKGYITDGIGFLRSLKEDGKFNPKNKKVFLFGAGGAAFAISGSLIKAGISMLTICNRTFNNALMLKSRLKKHFGFNNIVVVPFQDRNQYALWKDINLIINASSVGMKNDHITLIEEKNLNKNMFIYDIVYNRKTNLIKSAEKHRIQHLNGLSMLVFQGAVSFNLWTGKTAPIDIMKNSVILKQ